MATSGNPFHVRLHKVEVKVDKFTETVRETVFLNALISMESQGGNCLIFFVYYGLKPCIFVEVDDLLTTGSNSQVN